MIRIRRMRHSEVDSTRQLVRSIFPRSVVRLDADDLVFLAESSGRAVGFVHLVPRCGCMVLQGLGVRKSARSLGVGTLLMENALAALEDCGVPVYLKVKALNKAVNLYARHGFFLQKFGMAHVLVKKPNS
jgi:GNAT superfamily N-acetyltransferase